MGRSNTLAVDIAASSLMGWWHGFGLFLGGGQIRNNYDTYSILVIMGKLYIRVAPSIIG